MYNLKNKVSIVTGASRGIGKSIAINLAKNGSDLNLISRSKNQLYLVNKEINNISDVKINCYDIDVTNFQSVTNTINEIIIKSKKIDILVNNAGITKDNIIMRMTINDWNDVINTNLTGYFNMCKAVIKQMIKQRDGRIINISSIVGLRGNIGQTNYSASKAGIIGLSNSLSKEVGSRNITVNTICPGYIITNMTKHLNKTNKINYLEKIALNKFGKPEDIANLVSFLSSKESQYITGQTINVDGGMN